MKKVILLTVCLVSALSFSQKIKKKEFQINAGSMNLFRSVFPFYGSLDYGLSDDFSAGLRLEYNQKEKEFWNSTYKNHFGISLNGNYHFNSLLKISDKWDLYAGVSLTYKKINYDDRLYTGYRPDEELNFDPQIGVRYFITKRIGLNAEITGGDDYKLGGGNLRLGLTFKL